MEGALFTSLSLRRTKLGCWRNTLICALLQKQEFRGTWDRWSGGLCILLGRFGRGEGCKVPEVTPLHGHFPRIHFLSVHKLLVHKCTFRGSRAGLTSGLMWGRVQLTRTNEVPGAGESRGGEPRNSREPWGGFRTSTGQGIGVVGQGVAVDVL